MDKEMQKYLKGKKKQQVVVQTKPQITYSLAKLSTDTNATLIFQHKNVNIGRSVETAFYSV